MQISNLHPIVKGRCLEIEEVHLFTKKAGELFLCLVEYAASRKGEGQFAPLSAAKVMLEPGCGQGPSKASRGSVVARWAFVGLYEQKEPVGGA